MKITRRGKIVRAIAIVLGLALVYWISGHVWYVPGEGYCLGSLDSCGL